jgi:hypothetical protein
MKSIPIAAKNVFFTFLVPCIRIEIQMYRCRDRCTYICNEWCRRHDARPVVRCSSNQPLFSSLPNLYLKIYSTSLYLQHVLYDKLKLYVGTRAWWGGNFSFMWNIKHEDLTFVFRKSTYDEKGNQWSFQMCSFKVSFYISQQKDLQKFYKLIHKRHWNIYVDDMRIDWLRNRLDRFYNKETGSKWIDPK